ncbi:hypothetical protein ACA910_009507 [Epithemia clementina (nom. ined.)]
MPRVKVQQDFLSNKTGDAEGEDPTRFSIQQLEIPKTRRKTVDLLVGTHKQANKTRKTNEPFSTKVAAVLSRGVLNNRRELQCTISLCASSIRIQAICLLQRRRQRPNRFSALDESLLDIFLIVLWCRRQKFDVLEVFIFNPNSQVDR